MFASVDLRSNIRFFLSLLCAMEGCRFLSHCTDLASPSSRGRPPSLNRFRGSSLPLSLLKSPHPVRIACPKSPQGCPRCAVPVKNPMPLETLISQAAFRWQAGGSILVKVTRLFCSLQHPGSPLGLSSVPGPSAAPGASSLGPQPARSHRETLC